jgi:hypothetical protein
MSPNKIKYDDDSGFNPCGNYAPTTKKHKKAKSNKYFYDKNESYIAYNPWTINADYENFKHFMLDCLIYYKIPEDFENYDEVDCQFMEGDAFIDDCEPPYKWMVWISSDDDPQVGCYGLAVCNVHMFEVGWDNDAGDYGTDVPVMLLKKFIDEGNPLQKGSLYKGNELCPNIRTYDFPNDSTSYQAKCDTCLEHQRISATQVKKTCSSCGWSEIVNSQEYVECK